MKIAICKYNFEISRGPLSFSSWNRGTIRSRWPLPLAQASLIFGSFLQLRGIGRLLSTDGSCLLALFGGIRLLAFHVELFVPLSWSGSPESRDSAFERPSSGIIAYMY